MQPSLTGSVSRRAGSQVSKSRQLLLRKIALRQGVPAEAQQAGSFFVQVIPCCLHSPK